MKKTSLYQHHIDAGGTMTDFAGYTLPLSFTSIRQEHKHVREAVGVFDVSHMGEISISGPDAAAFMAYVFTSDLRNADDGTCHYGFLCYAHGGVVDDFIVYRMAVDNYLMVVNAANSDKDYEWLSRQIMDGWQLDILQQSQDYGQLAIQGPKAQEVVEGLLPGSAHLAFFTFQWFSDTYLVSRTGYTGEDGFEIIMPTTEIVVFYERLMAEYGKWVKPIGLGARDTLRFEACLPLYGHELSESISPVEAGLGRFLTNPENYIGKEVHLEQTKEPTRYLVAYKLKGKGVVRSGYNIVTTEGNVVGHVTTGYLLEGYETGLFLALVDASFRQDKGLQVQIRQKQVPIEAVKKPFYKKKYKRSE